MPKPLRGCTPLFACLSFTLVATLPTAAQDQKILQGGIKDDASLHSSLNLMPSGTTTSFLNGRSGQSLVQYSGSIRSGPQDPNLRNTIPTYAPTSLGGTIPPISTYSLRPSNSIMWFAPGSEVLPGSTTYGVSSYGGTGYQTTSASHKGVTSYDPSLAITVVTGCTTWPGAVPVDTQAFIGGALFYQAGGFVTTKSTTNGITSWCDGGKVAVTTSKNGVVCWSPGYEVSVQTADVSKETVGGIWSVPESRTKPLLAAAGVLSSKNTRVRLSDGETTPIMATPLLLPQARLQLAKPFTWDDWYKRVAKAIYIRWQNAEVGPGLADARITITRNRDVNCQIVEFKTAAEVLPNVQAETAFRQAAVDAIHLVSKFEIPEMPDDSKGDAVTFDIEMKRTVDGPIGFNIASARTLQVKATVIPPPDSH